ncbi:bifunctional 2',3'-cyclic-nucleotide 2'-phosphodiesterase/3'-nucleotidase [Vibrio kyushuensis]|uniref:bifunctional 2',3'-cyclic-nucleotide 2'-phosphodiesterase/3'-nucleotidase n=1 Tax=Vibrio kyushuensis TaxID=2910249 RepID=UPI003D0E226E
MTNNKKALLAVSIVTALAGCNIKSSKDPVTMQVRLMETTDLHNNMLPYNYFASEEANTTPQEYGLSRTAIIIEEARAEVFNSLLFDNGDLIQGSPMGDYMASKGVEHLEENLHPVYKAMNYLQYDAANIGNHEFNYGLDFMNAAIEGANFPYVNANVFAFEESALTGSYAFDEGECAFTPDDHFVGNTTEFFETYQPNFTPYVVLERNFIASNGKSYPINVGVIGFTPPNIMNWDKRHLECEVMIADIKAAAEYYVPLMKAGSDEYPAADIVVAVPHSGITNSDNGRDYNDNATWELARVEGVDAIMFGHDHNNFPTDGNAYDGMEGVDAANGKIFGVPAVMPGFWGNHLGVIDLALEFDATNESWSIIGSSATLKELNEDPLKQDAIIADLVEEEHRATMEFMNEEIGTIDEPINSYFSAIVSDISVQIVNEAQLAAAEQWQLDGLLENEDQLVLSVSAPFKGGRGGNTDYTSIATGPLTRASVADLYVFDNNTPSVLELTFADIKEWIEVTASQQYKTVAEDGDALLHQNFRSYNFDVFFGGFGWEGTGNDESRLTYTIDVSQEAYFETDSRGELVEDSNGNFIRTGSSRLTSLMFDGEEVTDVSEINDETMVYVVTNNYRASNSWMPGVSESEIVFADESETNRDLVYDYLMERAEDAEDNNDGIIEFVNADNFNLAGPTGKTVEFLSSIDDAAQTFVDDYLTPMIGNTDRFGSVDDNDNYRVYEVTFN